MMTDGAGAAPEATAANPASGDTRGRADRAGAKASAGSGEPKEREESKDLLASPERRQESLEIVEIVVSLDRRASGERRESVVSLGCKESLGRRVSLDRRASLDCKESLDCRVSLD